MHKEDIRDGIIGIHDGLIKGLADESGAFIGGVNRLIETNQEIDKQEARLLQQGDAKRVVFLTKDAREKSKSIFHRLLMITLRQALQTSKQKMSVWVYLHQ